MWWTIDQWFQAALCFSSQEMYIAMMAASLEKEKEKERERRERREERKKGMREKRERAFLLPWPHSSCKIFANLKNRKKDEN